MNYTGEEISIFLHPGANVSTAGLQKLTPEDQMLVVDLSGWPVT